MLKKLGNYKVLKGIKNEDNFLDDLKSIQESMTANVDIHGLYIHDGRLNKRYFCTNCNTIGPANYKEWAWNKVVKCPNCNANLYNINEEISGDKKIEVKNVEYFDVNKINKDKISISITDDRKYVEIINEDETIFKIEDDGTFLYQNSDNYYQLIRQVLSFIFEIFDYLNVLYNKGTLKSENAKFIFESTKNIDLFKELLKNYQLSVDAISLLEMLVYDKVDFNDWLKGENIDYFTKLLSFYTRELSNKDNDLYEDGINEIIDSLLYTNSKYKTSDVLKASLPDWIINDISIYNDMFSIIYKDDILEDQSFLFKYNELRESNIEAFTDLLNISILNNFNIFKYLNKLEHIISDKLGSLPKGEALDICVNFIKENKHYGLDLSFFMVPNVFEALEHFINYLNEKQLQINKYNLNRYMLNIMYNQDYLEDEYKIPVKRSELFNLLIDIDPLTAYSLLKTRREINDKELSDYTDLLKDHM